jgi:hypothetical protein
MIQLLSWLLSVLSIFQGTNNKHHPAETPKARSELPIATGGQEKGCDSNHPQALGALLFLYGHVPETAVGMAE